ncbi:MAG: extracellular solute-binding protein [Thermomicrobiales bacterium]
MDAFRRVPSLTRRRVVAGGLAAAAGTAAGLRGAAAGPLPFPGMRSSRQATPASISELRPSLHSYPLTTEQKTFRIMVPHYGLDWANNAFTQWYEELTGVHIEWVVVEDEGAITQLNLQLASGDYPDIIMGFNWGTFELTMTVIAAYGGQGIFVPLTDYLDEHAPNLKTYVIPEYPIAEKLVTMADGQVYSLPYINDCYHCSYNAQKMWVRTSWLDTLGIAEPTTVDEFTAMLQAIKEGDPNGNGKADEVPLTASLDWPLESYMMSPFQITPKQPWLYLQDGKVTASYTQDGWLAGTTYLRSLTDQKLLSSEIYTQNSDQFRALGDNDQIGLAPGVVAGVFITATDGTPGPWSDYRILSPVEGPAGRTIFRDYDESHLGNVFVVTDKCQDPALAVAWADGLYSWEATIRSILGVPGKNWRPAEDNELGIDGEAARYAVIPGDPNDTGDDQNVWGQLSPSFRNAKDRLSQAVVGDREANNEVILYEGCHEQLTPFATPETNDMMRPVFTADEAVRVSDLEKVIVDFVKQQQALEVTGQRDPESGRQEFLDQLNALGVEEYLALQQSAQDRMAGSSS